MSYIGIAMVPDSFWLTKTPLCFSGIRTKVNGQRRLTRRWTQSLTPAGGAVGKVPT
ncbi:hypothetical protein MCC01986_11830 [Bifidobacteriaceae bacterium MCC01986]|uniref:Uncharacterized protein n=1 Tax=Bifidobacterium longum subsp. longum TaxID=1679 RepID=A0AAV4L349_BIFLL|nr:hypothetical protein MCC01983_16390 [Bifidobacteriaceae bacterium MCC01983]GDZ66321.1 hypothetical protein MCC01986_11830 [Bifidobacteriaceae bacterium MCC01986]GHM72351.1 hypothetical protein MCC00316_06410 [Bifidobacterium longum subsp. longum]